MIRQYVTGNSLSRVQLTEVSGESEVADLDDTLVGHQDVLWLDVPMQTALQGNTSHRLCTSTI